MTGKMLSLIITSKDKERFIDICELLASVKMQDYKPLEVIFVSENNQLRSQVIDYAHESNMHNITILSNYRDPGLSGGRNVGIKAASGDIISFVDDDCLLYPDWAERMVEPYQDLQVIGVTGHALPLWDDNPAEWLPRELHWLLSCTTWFDSDKPCPVRNAHGMNMSFRREAFDKCGLFDNHYGYHKGTMAEDNEFSYRAQDMTGKVIMFSPDVKVLHKVHSYRLTPKFIRERAWWIGYSRYNIKRQYGKPTTLRLFDREHYLSHQLLTHLPKEIAAANPKTGTRMLAVTLYATLFVIWGYLCGIAKQRRRGETD